VAFSSPAQAPPLAAATLLPLAGWARAPKRTGIALKGCFAFVDANAGTILPQQIPADDCKQFLVPDMRDKTMLACCNTSPFAAQVAMALRLDGFESMQPLHGGYNECKARGGFDAHARAESRRSPELRP
jgi:rhodanese-related sulfurtransferase